VNGGVGSDEAEVQHVMSDISTRLTSVTTTLLNYLFNGVPPSEEAQIALGTCASVMAKSKAGVWLSVCRRWIEDAIAYFRRELLMA
jgi:hypothetical protein